MKTVHCLHSSNRNKYSTNIILFYFCKFRNAYLQVYYDASMLYFQLGFIIYTEILAYMKILGQDQILNVLGSEELVTRMSPQLCQLQGAVQLLERFDDTLHN